MVSKEEIIFNEPIYFTSDYSGATKISIIRLFDDGEALVKQYCKKKDFKPFTRPMTHIYTNSKDAEKGRKASWAALRAISPTSPLRSSH